MANGSRRQAREAALQVLYLVDLCKKDLAELPLSVWSENPLPEKTQLFSLSLANGVIASQLDLDRLIVKYTENWAMERMAAVDRCLLRLSAFELLRETETPINVIINEALEIAKKYSTAESSRFLNGILDKLKLEREA